MNLTPREREIAIQAIAARATGTPTQAAEQILKGISALDHHGKPFVVWPACLPFDEKVEALESELKKIRHAEKEMADYRTKWESMDSAANPESQGKKSPSEASRKPGKADESPQALGEEAAEAPAQLVKTPALGSSDAYQ
jgi:hypothetical protein